MRSNRDFPLLLLSWFPSKPQWRAGNVALAADGLWVNGFRCCCCLGYCFVTWFRWGVYHHATSPEHFPRFCLSRTTLTGGANRLTTGYNATPFSFQKNYSFLSSWETISILDGIFYGSSVVRILGFLHHHLELVSIFLLIVSCPDS